MVALVALVWSTGVLEYWSSGVVEYGLQSGAAEEGGEEEREAGGDIHGERQYRVGQSG